MPSSLARTTSGTVVMFMTSAPHDWKSLLSARLENLGPSMVMAVPLGEIDRPSSLPASYRQAAVSLQKLGCMGIWHTLPNLGVVSSCNETSFLQTASCDFFKLRCFFKCSKPSPVYGKFVFVCESGRWMSPRWQNVPEAYLPCKMKVKSSLLNHSGKIDSYCYSAVVNILLEMT